MDFSGIIKAVEALRAGPGDSTLSGFLSGERLLGKVVRLENDGRVLMDLKGVRVVAQVGFAVEEGQILDLKVIESGSRLHLKAEVSDLPPRAALPQSGFAHLFSPEQGRRWAEIADRILQQPVPPDDPNKSAVAIQNAVSRLNLAIAPLVPEGQEVQAAPIAVQLKGKLLNNGLFFEKKLGDFIVQSSRQPGADQQTVWPAQNARVLISHDVKPQLLVLKTLLSQPMEDVQAFFRINPEDVSFLRRTAQRMLGHIEQEQAHVAGKAGQDEPFQWISHVLATPDQNAPIQLKAYYPRRGKKGEKQGRHRIALLLQMDRLGLVRVDLAMVEDNLHIHFFVPDDAVRMQFAPHIDEVQRALDGFFGQVNINLLVSREKIARFHDEDSREKSPGRIDLKV